MCKVNPAPFMVEYNFQLVVTSFISIALIMMMTIGTNRSGLNSSVLSHQSECAKMAIISVLIQWNSREVVIVLYYRVYLISFVKL